MTELEIQMLEQFYLSFLIENGDFNELIADIVPLVEQSENQGNGEKAA